MAMDNKTCQICMDDCPGDEGLECSAGHFVCSDDISPYLRENVFPALYRLRRTECAVECPAVDCDGTFHSLDLFYAMGAQERSRYLSILKSYEESTLPLSRLRNSFQEILTLRCPK
mmetsp:Transcript_4924/g.7511  ORF Transcript_4924/g.7511 Transcript_4924/m.7511 type:complete len:116 (+) Transcript_4924:33-380(+)